MTMINSIHALSVRRLVSSFALSVMACIAGCASHSANYRNQEVFERPEDAAKRLSAALTAGDSAGVETIFGSESKETLSSGDPVADRWNRQIVAVAMNEQWTLEAKDATTRELVIGNEAWPFPIPLVKDDRGWWFDTVAGKQEVLARRVGRNELSTISTLKAYVAAQREYAGVGRDGKPVGIYAQKIRSDPGTHNGLYWTVSSLKEPTSPFGEFIAGASTEGYSTQTKEGTAPYHGYFYRILNKQGAFAPGGAKDYLVNGDMIGGFAMIAFPAEYGSSGVKTFIVGPDGTVYESDLGDNTAAVAGEILAYDPNGEWRAAQ